MIKAFRHKGIEAFFRTGSKAGIQPRQAGRLACDAGRPEQRERAR